MTCKIAEAKLLLRFLCEIVCPRKLMVLPINKQPNDLHIIQHHWLYLLMTLLRFLMNHDCFLNICWSLIAPLVFNHHCQASHVHLLALFSTTKAPTRRPSAFSTLNSLRGDSAQKVSCCGSPLITFAADVRRPCRMPRPLPGT